MLLDVSTLLHWVGLYGYPCLAVILLLAAAGVPIPVELLLLALGGLSAVRGGPDFLALAALGVGATVAGDALDYGIGRLLREQAFARLPGRRVWGRWLGVLDNAGSAGVARRAEGLWRLADWGSSGVMIFLSRCVLTPLEAPLSLLAGATRMPLPRFLAWDTLGEAVYVLGYLALGYTGAAALATSGPLIVVVGGAILLMTLGPLVAVHFLTRSRKAGGRGFNTEETEETKEHGESETHVAAKRVEANAA